MRDRSFSRWWTELVAAITDVVPLPLLILGLLLIAVVCGLLWYFWPAWVPRRLPRFTRRSRSKDTEGEPVKVDDAVLVALAEAEPEELPDLPADVFVSLAERYAADGRYAEAVRERLRAIVRDLVDQAVIEHRPGWTVTELATAAAAARPAIDPAVREASAIFSDLWYGLVPATVGHDDRMRTLTTAVHQLLQTTPELTGGRR